ncbi:MAG: hypothetical protein AAFY19_00310, partial [Pseudomonadota bacterium]
MIYNPQLLSEYQNDSDRFEEYFLRSWDDIESAADLLGEDFDFSQLDPVVAAGFEAEVQSGRFRDFATELVRSVSDITSSTPVDYTTTIAAELAEAAVGNPAAFGSINAEALARQIGNIEILGLDKLSDRLQTFGVVSIMTGALADVLEAGGSPGAAEGFENIIAFATSTAVEKLVFAGITTASALALGTTVAALPITVTVAAAVTAYVYSDLAAEYISIVARPALERAEQLLEQGGEALGVAALVAFDVAQDLAALVADGVDVLAEFLAGFALDPGGYLNAGLELASDFVIDIAQKFVDGIVNASPLVLDLDGDGIEMVALQDSTVGWDIDNDDFAELVSWVLPDDGLLAIDLDGNDRIDNHSELFGTATTDGFTVLAAYDTNFDGVINAQDDQFDDLILWQDFNQDGVSSPGEMRSLAEAGIVSISLDADRSNATVAGNEVSHVSTYDLELPDGT